MKDEIEEESVTSPLKRSLHDASGIGSFDEIYQGGRPPKRLSQDDYEPSDEDNVGDNDNDNDNYHVDQLSQEILEMTPSFGVTSVTKEMGNLKVNQEEGDELQKKAISIATEGENIFLTGKAGTGKSWTTRKILEAFDDQKKTFHMTAPTGIAAINVDGITIHRWAGFGLGEYYSDFDRMMDKNIMEKIRKTKSLLIDEISMMDGHLFDALECMVSIIRYYGRVKERLKLIKTEAERRAACEKTGGSDSATIIHPYMLKIRWDPKAENNLCDVPAWGGMQLVVVGDFFQLPPVPNSTRDENGDAVLLENDELRETEYNLKIGRQGSYAFESHAWRRSNLQPIELQQVHRQAENDGLIALLNAMREGEADLVYNHRDALNLLQAPLPQRDDGIIPTQLHSKNLVVNKINREELRKLSGDEHTFASLDEVGFCCDYKAKLLRKYKLGNISGHIPHLYASVELTPPSPELLEARYQLKRLEEKRKILLEQEDYENLIPVRREKNELKAKITATEKAEEESKIITLSSIQERLNNVAEISPVMAKEMGDPSEIFARIQHFQEQLKKDYKVLKKHADELFFQKQCRVGNQMKLKKNAQVMLLWNLDIRGKLANGSRGVVKGFVPALLYRKMLEEEMKRRKKVEAQAMVDAEAEAKAVANAKMRGEGKTMDNAEDGTKAEHEALMALADHEGEAMADTEAEHQAMAFADHEGEAMADTEAEHQAMMASADAKAEHQAMADAGTEAKTEAEAKTNDIDTKNKDDHQHDEKPSNCASISNNDPHQEKWKSEEAKVEEDSIMEDLDCSIDSEFLRDIRRHVQSMEDLSKDLRTLDKIIMTDIRDLPFVQFSNGSGRLILPQAFQKVFRGCGHAARWQIPLSLAWSISIHKSQGMTIDWLHVNLKDCFSAGQAYVACSRGRSLSSMTVENFNPNEIKTSKKVKQFYKSLNGGAPYTQTWSDTIAEYDKMNQDNHELRKEMEQRYKYTKCEECGMPCIVKQVKTNRSNNIGKWYIKCSESYGGGHTFEFVDVSPHSGF